MENEMIDPAMTDYAAMQRFAEGDEHQPNVPLVERVARAIAEKAADNGSHAYVGNSEDLTSVMLGGQFNLMKLACAAIAAMELPNPAPLHQDIPLHPNDGLQQDMTMNLLQNVAVYPSFQFWNTCAIRVGELSYSLQTISALDMFYVHSHQKSSSVCGLPTYISRSATTGDVAVYPTPDRDYELVRV